MRPALLTNFEVHDSLLLTVGMCCRAGLWNSSCVRASLAAQQKRIHLPMQETQETQVQFLGVQDLLEKEMVLNNNNLCVTNFMCLVTQSWLTLCDPMDYIACQAPLSMEFSRQEYWNGLSFPSPNCNFIPLDNVSPHLLPPIIW